MRWLYRRVSGTVPLQDPFLSWAEWERVMCKAPAVSGDGSSVQPHLRRSACVPLQPFSLAGVTLPPSARRSVLSRSMEFGSLMLPCRKAFVDRVSWACHASKLHGYRTCATELTRGVDQSWCSGCGKLFANPNRMKRHVFVTPACQEKWGSFRLDGSLPKHPLHPSAPPLQLPGSQAVPGPSEEGTQVPCLPALLEALLALEDSDDSQAWSAIQDFIAPIAHLRTTVTAWRTHPSAQAFAEEVAGNMLLLLDPDACCHVFQGPKAPPMRLDFTPPLSPLTYWTCFASCFWRGHRVFHH